jgi:two-component system, OmpR family, response regulator CpxR
MAEMTQRILLVDDDWELCDLLQEYLAAEGYCVESVHDGETGAQRALESGYDLIVLDVMLPGLNGFEVLRRIRAGSSIPVLMLTARGEEIDRILGLEMGADDYLPKPFNHRELLARLRAIQRRIATAKPDVEVVPDTLRVGEVALNSMARTVRCGEELVELTSAEFSVLEVLLRQAGKIISREEILLQAHGRQLSYNDRSIDVHMSNLRRKLGTTADGTERIKSVRGIGYVYPLTGTESGQRG